MKILPTALAICFAAGALYGADSLPSCSVTPGWTQSGPSRTYSADNLYDYMDGNSEGYLVYGFQQMHGVTCKSGEVSFVVDISTMDDEEAAFGLFASNRDPRLPVEAIGVSGQIVPQRGFFVKGRWFVEISASPSTDHTSALRTFLKAMEARLEGTTAAPSPLGWFPNQGLDTASVRLIPESVLGLSVLKKGYLAKYDYGRAFLVRQPSNESGAQVMAKLRQRFGNVTPLQLGDEAFETNDKYLGHLIFFRKGVYLAGFANLQEGFDPGKVSRELAASIP